MAAPVNCGINEKASELSYKLTPELAAQRIEFSIKASSEEGKDVGVLEITGQSARKDESKPFPTGSLKVKSQGLKTVEKKQIYRVQLKKIKDIDLEDYF